MATPGGRMAREVGGQWEPKYPDRAIEESRKVGEILAPEIFRPKFRRLDWVPAPPRSHLLSFAFSDARKLLLLKHPETGEYVYRSPSELPRSRIHIKFKAKGKAPVVQYMYESILHDLLERVFDLLKSSDHPGEILHAHLEKNGAVQYHQEAVMG